MIDLRRLLVAGLPGCLWIAMMVVAGSGLVGCASRTSDAKAGTSRDILTESDEPEIRKRARLHLELALGYFNNGQTTVALDAVKQSLNADPSMVESYNLRGLIYMRLDNIPLAEESFRKALSLDPRNGSAQQNYAWMLCQQSRFSEAAPLFNSVLANPSYGERSKTLMTMGLCQLKEGRKAEAEASFMRSYELDAGNPITGYNLALLLFQRNETTRAQFYVRLVNNCEYATAASLWLGMKVDRQLGNTDAVNQLGAQLKKRFPQSKEASAYDRGAFDE